MGKICAPPPFKGGQTVGVDYWVGYSGRRTSDGLRLYNFAEALITGAILPVRVSLYNADPNFVEYHLFNSSGYQVLIGRWFSNQPISWTISIRRVDGRTDLGGDPPTNCRCSDDSCRVDCAGVPDGFCCLDHSVTNRLLQVLTT